ncbi:hypothetical protein CXZ10_04990 [Pleomorphomonas diazotrophica]|uniref:DUF4037 domain-containing protein n=1 Tax=Pleomorphomonas diazotrophica TaxID=1166257 RepID=A0A1I4QEG3_9HYPH|nr:DUF4037 domain-containing protein [Pleomorphomonas diazotrophica]PKR90716.1 hypothetical protein CXZ10_04990 [Pleomorphomonas diazotrophica]SFM38502.1 protein of unknown function [Pleomorphomonas diazotrophica]
MKGVHLSNLFYRNVVRPWLDEAFPSLRHDAGIFGYGSELLGFDDDMSRDHNWGPRVQLVVTDGDFATHAAAIIDGFDAVKPATFLGEPIGYRSRPHPPIVAEDALGRPEHGVEVFTAKGMLRTTLALDPGTPLDALIWLSLPEQKLLELTAGEVFHTGLGALPHLRETFARCPRDVTLYKLAAQWRRIADEQAFVGRAGYVGDDLGSRVIAARLVRDIMRVCFLLEGRYAPYAKWFGSAFARLASSEVLLPMLTAVLEAETWEPRQAGLAQACLVVAEMHAAAGFPLSVTPRIGPYYDRPFPTINAEDLSADLAASIVDPLLRGRPVVGSIDQVTDATPLIASPEGARKATFALLADRAKS